MERVRQAMERALEQKWEPSARNESLNPSIRRRLSARRSDEPRRRSGDRFRIVKVSEQVLTRNKLVVSDKESRQREAFSVLQANIASSMRDNGWQSIGVTSPGTGSGKTLTAINLAIALALQSSRKILLLDLDFDHPDVHLHFDYAPELGLEDVLFEGTTVEQAAFKPGLQELAVLPLRRRDHNALQILRSDNLRTVLENLKEDYPDHLIVVNFSAVPNAETARLISSLIDCTLLIVEDNVTRESHFRKALNGLDRTRLLGTVLNRAN